MSNDNWKQAFEKKNLIKCDLKCICVALIGTPHIVDYYNMLMSGASSLKENIGIILFFPGCERAISVMYVVNGSIEDIDPHAVDVFKTVTSDIDMIG